MNIHLERFYGGAVRSPEDGSGSAAPEPSTLAGAAAEAAAAAAAAPAAKVPSLGDALYGSDDEKAAEVRAAATAAAEAAKVPGDKTDAEKAAADAAKATADAAAADALKPKEYVNDDAKTADENKALKAAHDKAEGERVAKLKEDADKDAKADKRTPDEIAAAAAAYTIDPPAGFELDASVDKEFRELAAKNNYTQEQVDELKSVQIKLYEAQAAKTADEVAKWGDEVKADKELGGANTQEKMGVVGRAINEFFPKSVATMLNKTGLGNYPDMVRGFYRIGLAMGEMPTFKNNTTTEGGTIAERLYGDK